MPPSRQARRVVRAVPLVLAACRRRAVQDPAGPARLSPHLARILEHLDRRRPLAPGELARRLRVTPATISLQLSRLIRLRLVTRTPDPADARRALLRLTEAGLRVRDQLSLLDPGCVEHLLLRIPGAEREKAVAGIEALGRAAEPSQTNPERPGKPAPPPRSPSSRSNG